MKQLGTLTCAGLSDTGSKSQLAGAVERMNLPWVQTAWLVGPEGAAPGLFSLFLHSCAGESVDNSPTLSKSVGFA